MKFSEAMAAIEDGKQVQHLGEDGSWYDYSELVSHLTIRCAHKMVWRIKPEPVKYSVEIWLSREPKATLNNVILLDTF